MLLHGPRQKIRKNGGENQENLLRAYCNGKKAGDNSKIGSDACRKNGAGRILYVDRALKESELSNSLRRYIEQWNKTKIPMETVRR